MLIAGAWIIQVFGPALARYGTTNADRVTAASIWSLASYCVDSFGNVPANNQIL